jgi:nickel/cobalt transporter (NiCoT) family protein
LFIGTIELVSVLHDSGGWTNGFSDAVSAIDLNDVGFVVVGLFVVVWGAAIAYWNVGQVEERWAAPRDPYKEIS